jgi:glycerate kinase
MIADAVRRGCRKIIVGLGGSATSDAGKGMMRALKDAFGEDLSDLKDVHFTIATDVRNPLYGPDGAAAVFAPQKGATPDMVAELDRRAKVFAAQAAQQMGFDRSMMPGAGAAGGLGYAFMQFLNAQCRPGIDLLLDAIGFQSLLQNADLVITGEGSADRQTLMGKLPTGILRRAQLFHIPVVLIAGRVANREDLLRAGFARVECINPPDLPLQEALLPHVAKANIRRLMKTCIP